MKELELILSTISQLGVAGKEAFIWWLVFDKLIPGLVWLATVLIFSYVIRQIVSICSVGAKLRDAMGVGRKGALIEDEVRDMFKWISDRRNQTSV